jgi:7-cyano-7-deazaguanine reductase
MSLVGSVLGKQVKYLDQYNPELLYQIPRSIKRAEIGIDGKLPFYGVDIWNAYEISWLDPKGKPRVIIGRFYIPAGSEFIIESKSLKLYLNSFNNTKFIDLNHVQSVLVNDLSKASNSEVRIDLYEVDAKYLFAEQFGKCIDGEDIQMDMPDDVAIAHLQISGQDSKICEEKIYTNLFKSNCLVTSQPDWASVLIHYKGPAMNHASLLKYLISYRNHQGFHEQCVEKIYVDLMKVFNHEHLSVLAQYTRRGGIDICPYRSTHAAPYPELCRLSRQ